MIGRVEQVGPKRAQLYVKEMAPLFVLVPIEELPPGVKRGDQVQIVIELLAGQLDLGDIEEAGRSTDSHAGVRPVQAGGLDGGRLRVRVGY